jgi:sterol desaturase/sphingolipid hydroxylase (fatty acid hydroxylase superfamily)
VYLFIVIMSNTFSHSGYLLTYKNMKLKSGIYHDNHHRLFNKNYGINRLMDTLFGTNYMDSNQDDSNLSMD